MIGNVIPSSQMSTELGSILLGSMFLGCGLAVWISKKNPYYRELSQLSCSEDIDIYINGKRSPHTHREQLVKYNKKTNATEHNYQIEINRLVYAGIIGNSGQHERIIQTHCTHQRQDGSEID